MVGMEHAEVTRGQGGMIESWKNLARPDRIHHRAWSPFPTNTWKLQDVLANQTSFIQTWEYPAHSFFLFYGINPWHFCGGRIIPKLILFKVRSSFMTDDDQGLRLLSFTDSSRDRFLVTQT